MRDDREVERTFLRTGELEAAEAGVQAAEHSVSTTEQHPISAGQLPRSVSTGATYYLASHPATPVRAPPPDTCRANSAQLLCCPGPKIASAAALCPLSGTLLASARPASSASAAAVLFGRCYCSRETIHPKVERTQLYAASLLQQCSSIVAPTGRARGRVGTCE